MAEPLTLGGEEKLTAPALIELRGCFSYTGGTESCTPARTTQLVPSGFGGDFPTGDLGPASVALSTGEMSLSATDAADSTSGVGRTFTSYDATTVEPGVFGPGWSATTLLAGAEGAADEVIDNRDKDGSIVLDYVAGGSQTFVGSTTANEFTPLEATGDDTSLTYTPAAADTPATLVLSVPTGAGHNLTTWELQPSDTPGAAPGWVVQQADAQGPENTVTVTSTNQRITWIAETDPAASATCTRATQSDGCRGLKLDYTGTGAEARVAAVSRVIGAPAGSPVTETQIATYTYNLAGELTQVCGPDPDGDPSAGDPALCTGYSYADIGGRTVVKTESPAGMKPWRFGYDAAGRLIDVKRERPAGDPTGGDAVWSIDYTLALTAAGLPDMSAAAITEWGQTGSMVPTKAYAVYAPRTGVSDVTNAQVFYTRDDDTVTNTAIYGPGGWQVETNWRDALGNTIQTLDGAGWARVQDVPADGRPELAAQLSSYTVYNNWGGDDVAGTRVVDEYGPARTATLKNGTTDLFRPHTAYLYDDDPATPAALLAGRPTPAEGEEPGLGLVVQETTSAATVDRTLDFDKNLVRNDYQPVVDGDGNGWGLGTPTRVLTQSGPNIGTGFSGDFAIEVTRTDKTGHVIESRQPGGVADSVGAGNDAHATVITYYTGTGTGDCGGEKAWAGLLCKTGPAALPTGTPMPTRWTSNYSAELQPEVVKEYSDNGNVRTIHRTTTTSYDQLGRPTQVVKQTSGDGVSHETITTHLGYAAATGLATTASAAGKTISTGHDTWGRTTAYTDALGTHSESNYTADGQLKTFDDSAGVYTYAYDNHGALTSVDAGGGVGAFTFDWNEAGDLDKLTYPNGMVADRNYDQVGGATGLTYRQGGEDLLAFTATLDVDGRTVANTSSGSAQDYTYDRLQRLTKVEDSRDGGCTTRTYGFDASSDRTGYASYAPAEPDGACQTGIANVAKVNTYDGAGRIQNTGYTYDSLGRAVTTPSTETDL